MYSENRSKLCPNVFTKSYSSQSLHHTLWRIGFIQKKKKKKKVWVQWIGVLFENIELLGGR